MIRFGIAWGIITFKTTNDSIFPNTLKKTEKELADYQEMVERDTTLSQLLLNEKKSKIRSLERQLNNEFNLLNSYQKSVNKYEVEIHKKISLPVACILFVLLGAPLGVLAKKGGFVVGISLSFGFFLIYYLLLIGGEEMADRNYVSATIGMWAPNVLLFITALYLTVRTARERTEFRLKLPSFLKLKNKGKT